MNTPTVPPPARNRKKHVPAMTVERFEQILASQAATVRRVRARLMVDDDAAVRSVLRVLADGRPHNRDEMFSRTNIVRAARLDHVLTLIADRITVTRFRRPPAAPRSRAAFHGRVGTYYALKAPGVA